MTWVGGKWKHKAETSIKGNFVLRSPEPEEKKHAFWGRKKQSSFNTGTPRKTVWQTCEQGLDSEWAGVQAGASPSPPVQ